MKLIKVPNDFVEAGHEGRRNYFQHDVRNVHDGQAVVTLTADPLIGVLKIVRGRAALALVILELAIRGHKRLG